MTESMTPSEQTAIRKMIELYDTIEAKYGPKFPFTLYGYYKEADDLFQLFYTHFYLDTGKEAVDVKEFIQPEGIETANLNQIRFFIGDIIQNDKFIQDLFLSLIKDGTIRRVVERLKELLD